jgi:hypothetical protein
MDSLNSQKANPAPRKWQDRLLIFFKIRICAITGAVLFSSKFYILTIFILCMFLVFLFDLIHFFFLCQISVRVCEKYN